MRSRRVVLAPSSVTRQALVRVRKPVGRTSKQAQIKTAISTIVTFRCNHPRKTVFEEFCEELRGAFS